MAQRPQKKQKLSRANRIISYTASFAVLILGFGVLAVRLYTLQVTNGDYYRQLASEQQLKDSTIQAVRGEIYDSTGKTLASTSIVWNISCDPRDSNGLYTKNEDGTPLALKEDVCSAVSAGIAKILTAGDGSDGSGVDMSSEAYTAQYDYIYARMSRINSQYRQLASRVDMPVAEAVRAFISEYNAANDGVSISVTVEKTFKRNYPYGAFAASVLGFCDDSGAGSYGLERSYNAELSGVNGRSITIKNAFGNEVANDDASVYAAQDGYNLVLTLDTNIQEIAERYLDEAVAANTVENRASAIVMNVKTGAVLAMATKPDFDPNDPYAVPSAEYFTELVKAEPELYAHYQTDEEGKTVVDSLGNPVLDAEYDYTGTFREIQWKNKAITELYYPGSVFKVITAAAGLDSGVATLNTSFHCSGEYTVADHRYHCASRKAHGTQNMAAALRNSCNIYFIQLAQRMGAQTFYDYFKGFGFTEVSGVDLPYESTGMQYYTPSRMGEAELASSGFGQSMAITPLQTCAAIAACANGGYLVTPHLVDRITDAGGNVVKEITTTVKRQVVSETVSQGLREIMEYEVGNSTTKVGGFNAYVAGYRIGGKSGTSEQLNMDKREDGDYKKVASFVAVLPADDPEILVYVMLDDPNNANTDYSSVLAAPVVGNIISEAAPYLGLATDGTDLTAQTVEVPKLIGKEWSNAQVALNRAGLKHRLVESSGSNVAAPVTYQYPAAGTKVAGGTTVYIYTEGSGSNVTVPGVEGKTAAFARQMLSAAGLNCIVTGDTSGVVVSQDIPGGTSAEMGTVVTVTCAVPQPDPEPDPGLAVAPEDAAQP